MAFGLIIIGDEILSGRRSDKHLPKVIELLGERGLPWPGPRSSATIRRASPRC
jgi:molybdopterin-biosynthesis enzyme MoeA-like protein